MAGELFRIDLAEIVAAVEDGRKLTPHCSDGILPGAGERLVSCTPNAREAVCTAALSIWRYIAVTSSPATTRPQADAISVYRSAFEDSTPTSVRSIGFSSHHRLVRAI
jgi:hypothetical protein